MPKKKINVKTRQKAFLALLDEFKYTSKQISNLKPEERQIIKDEIIAPLIAYARKNKKYIDFNISGSEHSQNVISLALEFDAIDEVRPLLEHRKFEPNRKNYFQIIHDKKMSKSGAESIRYAQLLDHLITKGAHVPNSYRNMFFGIHQLDRYSSYNTHYASKGCSDQKKCISCQDEITADEPYLWGLSNCECVIHFECCFPLINSIINDLTNKNPLERNIPQCPHCKVTLSPSFIHSLHRTLFANMTITNPIISCLPANFKDFKECLTNFEEMKLSFISDTIYLLRYVAHPDRRNCKEPNCDGFRLVSDGKKLHLRCPKCHKHQNFVGKSLELKKRDLEQFLEIIRSKKDSHHNGIRPCPNCHQLIQKRDGCDHMVCGTCHKDFTWSRRLVSESRLAKIK